MTRLPMPRPIPTLQGHMIIMRPIDPDRDASDYFHWNADPEMHLWTYNEPFRSIEDARAELIRLADMPDISTWMIVEKATARVIGRFFLCMEKRNNQTIIGEGNRIARSYWRKGHNCDARQLMFRYAFDELKADEYETACWSENINSCKSIESHGFELANMQPEYNSKYDKDMNKNHYRMSSAYWRNMQPNASAFVKAK